MKQRCKNMRPTSVGGTTTSRSRSFEKERGPQNPNKDSAHNARATTRQTTETTKTTDRHDQEREREERGGGRGPTNDAKRRNEKGQPKEQHTEPRENTGHFPPSTTDLVTSQTGETVNYLGGPPKDCTRVFPTKDAADALCNPKADVPRCVAHQATQGT